MLGVRIVKEQNVGQDMRYYELLDQRVVTSGMAIAAMTVYMKPGIRPLSSEERRRVELIMRLTLNFVCRNRMQRSIEDLAFYDYDGYRNTGACRTISCRSKERAGLWASRLCGIICGILRW